MSIRQVIVLWSIAIILALVVTVVKINQGQESRTATERSPGETLFERFAYDEVAVIRISEAEAELTLRQGDEGWTVVERDHYPANLAAINGLLRTVNELKVSQSIEAGPSFAPRFGMDPAASDPEERGLTLEFANAGDEVLATLSVGKAIESADDAAAFGGGGVGRFVRNHDDDSGFYAVGETFPALSGNPRRWLDDAFLRLQRIRSVEVVDGEGNGWKVVRESEDGDFSLADAAPGERLDPAAVNPLKSLFSFARFEDVVPPAGIEQRRDSDQVRQATIETFDGLIYRLSFAPAKDEELAEDWEDDGFQPPASANRILTVTVEGGPQAERPRGEDESDEEAARLDAEFEARAEELREILATARRFEGRGFVVGGFSLEALERSREELLAEPEVLDTSIGSPDLLQPSARPPAETPRVEAVTPPIAIPPFEEDEGNGEDEDDAAGEGR